MQKQRLEQLQGRVPNSSYLIPDSYYLIPTPYTLPTTPSFAACGKFWVKNSRF